MDTQEPSCASPQLPPSCSSERAALPCWGTATFFGLLASETRQGAVPRQRAKFSACEQWAGKASGGGRAEGEGLASFHRRRMSLDLPLGHSLGKGCPGRSRREARAAQRKAPTEILFPGRDRPHCQPHPARLPPRPRLGTEEEREANLRSLLKQLIARYLLSARFFPGICSLCSSK